MCARLSSGLLLSVVWSLSSLAQTCMYVEGRPRQDKTAGRGVSCATTTVNRFNFLCQEYYVFPKVSHLSEHEKKAMLHAAKQKAQTESGFGQLVALFVGTFVTFGLGWSWADTDHWGITSIKTVHTRQQPHISTMPPHKEWRHRADVGLLSWVHRFGRSTPFL